MCFCIIDAICYNNKLFRMVIWLSHLGKLFNNIYCIVNNNIILSSNKIDNN